jgi:hypothetical protein
MAKRRNLRWNREKVYFDSYGIKEDENKKITGKRN